MNSIKRKIRNRFDLASHTYEKVAQVQRECAEILVEKLRGFDFNFYPKTILDLGTGTGYVPEVLLPFYSDSSYVLNDLAPAMIELVQNKFKECKNFSFCTGDFEELDFRSHDLIISNFALQWVHDLEMILQRLFLQSEIFAFSCLVAGTFKEWDEVLKDHGLTSVIKHYPAEENLISFLESLQGTKYHFDIRNFELTFSDLRSFMIYLKELGASNGDVQVPASVVRSVMVDQKKDFKVTYKVFFGIIQRS